MTNTTIDVSIFNLDEVGEYLFIYSDKLDIYFIFLNRENKQLYQITTDKYFTIKHVDEIFISNNIDTRDIFESYSINFFKPFIEKDNNIVFKGIIIFADNLSFKFEIKNLRLEYQDKVNYIKPNFELLNCISNIKVKAYIQKKQHIYLIGYDDKYGEEVYAKVNIENNVIEILHSFYTDLGEIKNNTINIDSEENKILVGGCINMLNNENVCIGTKPYIQTFMDI